MPFGFHSLFGEQPSRSDLSLSSTGRGVADSPGDIIDKQAEEEESRAVTRRIGRLLKGGGVSGRKCVSKKKVSRSKAKGGRKKASDRGKRPQTNKGKKKPTKKAKSRGRTKAKPGGTTTAKQRLEAVIRALSTSRRKPRKAASARQR